MKKHDLINSKQKNQNDRSENVVLQIRELEEYYQSLSIEADNRALNLTAVDCSTQSTADQFSSASLPYSSLSSTSSCVSDAHQAWDWLHVATRCLQIHLHNAAAYHEFYHELAHHNKTLQTISSQIKTLEQSRSHVDTVTNLTRNIKSCKLQLLDVQNQADSLSCRCSNLVPVHLRRLPVESPIKITAIATYWQKNKLVKEDDECCLIDNSDPARWKVRTNRGEEVFLPSLIFLIPPPDTQAIQNTHRLRRQLLTTWKSCVQAVKQKATSLVSNYLDRNDSRQVAHLDKEAQAAVVDSLTEAGALLSRDPEFRKEIDSWKNSVQNIKNTLPDNKGIGSKLQTDWSSHHDLLQEIREFNAYCDSYGENLSSVAQTKQHLVVNRDLLDLRYVSVAYIERWPNSANGSRPETSNEDGGRLQHIIVAELGPVLSDKYISRLDAELEERTEERITEKKEETEFTSQTIKETQKFFIRGVHDPRTNEQISIYQAIAEKIICHNEGLYRNPVTGESMPIPEAMEKKLIHVEYSNRSVEMGELIKSGIIKTITTKETVSYLVLSIKDPKTGQKISIQEALKRGIVDQEAGRYIVDRKSGESISFPTAIDKGFVEVREVERRANDIPDSQRDVLVSAVYDLKLKTIITLDEAVKRGLIDVDRGFYVNLATGEKMSLQEAVQRGFLEVSLANDDVSPDDPRLIGRRMKVLNNNNGMKNFGDLVVKQTMPFDIANSIHEKVKNNDQDERKSIIDPTSGKKMTLTEALSSGILSLDPLCVKLADGTRCTLFEAVAQGVIDSGTANEVLKSLEPFSLQKLITDQRFLVDSGEYIDLISGESMSLSTAITSHKLDPRQVFYMDVLSRSIVSLKTAIDYKKWDPETGTILDPSTGEWIYPVEAIKRKLIDPNVCSGGLSGSLSSITVLQGLIDGDLKGIKNPHTGEEMSLMDAIVDGILDIHRGEYVDPETNERMSIAEAVSLGLISSETARKIFETLGKSTLEDMISQQRIDPVTGKFIDPVTKRRITVREAMDSGLMDPGTVFLVDPTTGQLKSLSVLIQEGKYNPDTGKFKDPASRLEVNIANAIKLGMVKPNFEPSDYTKNSTSLQDLLSTKKVNQQTAMFTLPNGETIPLKEALAKGYISPETSIKIDRQTGNIVLAEDDEGVIGCLMETKENLDFVVGLESELANQKYVVDDVDKLKDSVTSYQQLKLKVDGNKDKVMKNVSKARRLSNQIDSTKPLQSHRIKSEAGDLGLRFEAVSGHVNNRFDKVVDLLGQVRNFDESYDALDGWMRSASDKLEGLKQDSAEAEDLTSVIHLTKSFQNAFHSKSSSIESLNSLGHHVTASIKKHNDDVKMYLQDQNHNLPLHEPKLECEDKLKSIGNMCKEINTESESLLTGLISAANNESKYEELKSELTNTFPLVKDKVSRCSVDGKSSEKLKMELDKVVEIATGVVELGKLVDNVRKTGDDYVESLKKIGVNDSQKKQEIEMTMGEFQSKFDDLQGEVVEKQNLLNKAVVESQDVRHNLLSMIKWVTESEERLKKSRPVSLDRSILSGQIQEQRLFSTELESRRPRLNAITEQCQSQGGDERLDELLDRFDVLTLSLEQRGQQLEDVSNELDSLYGNVDQLEAWLANTVQSLKREGGLGDQKALKSKIENLYKQKQAKEEDLEKIKTIGRELINGSNAGDKHRLRETLADIQGKWHDLTELLVQMISYAALVEIDDLLKYLDRAENEINTADPISADPDALALQLRNHKAFHEDLSRKRQAVNDTIDRCNQMLRETTNEEADDIKNKLGTIRDQADLVFRLSSERCSALEDALPLATHLSETHSDLQSWLNEMEAEIGSLEANAGDGSIEQIRKQREHAKATQRIIDDHNPLIDDLLATGQELTEICGDQDAHLIRQDLQHVNNQYNNIKGSIREIIVHFDDVIRKVSTELNDSVEQSQNDLYQISDQLQLSEPVAGKTSQLVEQMKESQLISDDLKQCAAEIQMIKFQMEHLMQMEANENSDEMRELGAKLQDLEALQNNTEMHCLNRARQVEGALSVAEHFQQVYGDTMQTLQAIHDNLVSQDSSGVDPSTIIEQQKELQVIQEEYRNAEESFDTCQKIVENLSELCGAAGAVELQKQMEDLDHLAEVIQTGLQKREQDLNAASKKSENYANYMEKIASWLPDFEEKLDSMAPVASDTRTLRSQADQLNTLKLSAQDHFSDLQNLNYYAAGLKNISPVSAESVMAEVKEIDARWKHLVGGISDREHGIRSRLLQSGEVEPTIKAIMETIRLAERNSSDVIELGDAKEVEAKIKTLQMLQKDLTNQEPLLHKLNNIVQSVQGTPGGEQLTEKWIALNEAYSMVQVSIRDRLNELQDELKELKALMGNVEDLTHWMDDHRNNLMSNPTMGALPDTIRVQIDDFMKGYEELGRKEEEAKVVLLKADDILCQTRQGDGEEVNQLQQGLNDLQVSMDKTRKKAEKQKRKLETHAENVDRFHDMVRVHTDWVGQADKQLASFKTPSKLMDKVTKQLADHQHFRESLDQHSELISDLERTGSQLKCFGRRQDTVYVKSLLMSMQIRWRRLVRKVNERGRMLMEAAKEDKKFYDQWKSLSDWLEISEQKLKRNAVGSSTKVKQDMEELQQFQQQLSEKHPMYYGTCRLGRNLKDTCLRSDPECDVLSSMLDQLKEKWNSIRSLITLRQNKLDEALLSSGRVSDAVSSLMEWLTNAADYLNEDQPLLGDLDTVTMLTEQHKGFQQELNSRQSMVEAIHTNASDDPSIVSQLDELDVLWQRVNRLSDLRDTRLQDAMKLASEFQEAVQIVREWLPQAESELKFRAILEDDEDHIVQLIEDHEAFQEELRSQQPNIEKISFMSDEILDGCHPNAVRFVRYYLTITQTRWEQAMFRSNQRAQRLQEALRNIRGNAALVEDLLAWLTEAHSLLAAKERDMIADDLMVVEVLAKEHLEFHDELSTKNRDVERLVKAPTGATNWKQFRGSNWKLNERDALLPRVNALQNKWRTVWRMSVDRKKRLQDTLDHLLELESFKSFNFDQWRQRYVEWIKSKKLRITDFFRRQDKNGFGTLDREQFVNGMLISKFPTTRMELNAIFDMFDRHRTGEINYTEFIEALRPDRLHGSRRTGVRIMTDAELINDEIEQQASLCQCRRSFAVAKISDGKYKLGEKGKLCLVRFLNNTVMVRVGGGWITLASFLDSNDPCRAKGRLNLDIKDQLPLPSSQPIFDQSSPHPSSDRSPALINDRPSLSDHPSTSDRRLPHDRRLASDRPSSSPSARVAASDKRRPTTPTSLVLESRHSGSVSSLTNAGGKGATSSLARQTVDNGSLANKRDSPLTRSCTSLASVSSSGGGENRGKGSSDSNRVPSATRRSTAANSVPNSYPTTRPQRPTTVSSTSGTHRANGSNGNELTVGGNRTPNAPKTPTGSRSVSPAVSKKSTDRIKLSSVKQNMKF